MSEKLPTAPPRQRIPATPARRPAARQHDGTRVTAVLSESRMLASQLRERLVGAWRLVSYEIRPRDGGTITYPLGRDARGWILYTPDGYMSAQLMAAGRPPYADGDLQGGSVEERAAAAHGYIAYSGPFNVDDDGTLTHEMDVSLYPNWIGNVQQRVVSLDGDRLQLGTTAPIRIGGREVEPVLVWARARR